MDLFIVTFARSLKTCTTHKTKLDLRLCVTTESYYFFYLKTIFAFQWLITFQTSPIHCLYALDLRARCAIFFDHYNLEKKKNSFFLSIYKSFFFYIDEGILAVCLILDLKGLKLVPPPPHSYNLVNITIFSYYIFYNFDPSEVYQH